MHIFELVKQVYDQFPGAKYVGFYNYGKTGVMIRDPELIKSIGVKHFDLFPNHLVFVDENADPIFGKSLFLLKDEKWRKVRQLLTPAFTTTKMRTMFELITKVSAKFSRYVADDLRDNKTEFEMKELFARYTNDVIATCAFGIEVDSMENKNNDFYKTARVVTSFSGWMMTKMFFITYFPKLAKLCKIRVFDDKLTYFKNVIKTTIEMRITQKIVRPDMLQLMIESSDKSGTVEMNVEDMTAHAFVFFFGGFESSSSLMSFVATALALHPQVQTSLYEEIKQVEKEGHQEVTYEIINNMPYLDAVIYETMRLYSVTGLVDRVCNSRFELPPAVEGGKPFTITPGMLIWFPAIGLQMDPKYYSEPDEFRPERFLEKKSYSSTFLPFGVGPRSCIGSRFAVLQTKIVIFHLLSKVQFKPSEKLKLPLQLDSSTYNVIADGGFRLQLLPRQS